MVSLKGKRISNQSCNIYSHQYIYLLQMHIFCSNASIFYWLRLRWIFNGYTCTEIWMNHKISIVSKVNKNRRIRTKNKNFSQLAIDKVCRWVKNLCNCTFNFQCIIKFFPPQLEKIGVKFCFVMGAFSSGCCCILSGWGPTVDFMCLNWRSGLK